MCADRLTARGPRDVAVRAEAASEVQRPVGHRAVLAGGRVAGSSALNRRAAVRRELVRVCAVRGHVVLPAGTRLVEGRAAGIGAEAELGGAAVAPGGLDAGPVSQGALGRWRRGGRARSRFCVHRCRRGLWRWYGGDRLRRLLLQTLSKKGGGWGVWMEVRFKLDDVRFHLGFNYWFMSSTSDFVHVALFFCFSGIFLSDEIILSSLDDAFFLFKICSSILFIFS